MKIKLNSRCTFNSRPITGMHECVQAYLSGMLCNRVCGLLWVLHYTADQNLPENFRKIERSSEKKNYNRKKTE